MDDLTTRAAKLLWSKLPHPNTCPDEIDEAARAAVKLVLDEAEGVLSRAVDCVTSGAFDQSDPRIAALCDYVDEIRALGTELKQCPFCGGKANGGFYPGDYDISCEACEFSISRHICDCGGSEEKAKDSAIAAWNRRADLARAKVKP